MAKAEQTIVAEEHVSTSAKGTVYTSVTMEDGRIVDFPGKRKILKTALPIVAGEALAIRLDFKNGQTRLFTLPEQLVAQFALHGASQKLGDEVSGVEDLDDAVIGIDELIDRLYNGDWNTTRTASSLAGASILAKALVEVTGKTAEEIRDFLKGKSHQEKIALRSNPRVKVVVDRLEAEKSKKTTQSVDTDALLAGLGV